MKKISLKSLNFSEIERLSQEDLKNVLGGDDPPTSGGGSCYMCMDNVGNMSCWYSLSPETLCQRVYPNTGGVNVGQTPCWDCTMN